MRLALLSLGVVLLVAAGTFWLGLALAVVEDPSFATDAVVGGLVITALPLLAGLFLIRAARRSGDPWHPLMSGRRRRQITARLDHDDEVRRAVYVTSPGMRARQVTVVAVSGVLGILSTLVVDSVLSGLVAFLGTLVAGEVLAASIGPDHLGLGILVVTDRRVSVIGRSPLSGGLTRRRIDQPRDGTRLIETREGFFTISTLLFPDGSHVEVETTRGPAADLADALSQSAPTE